MGTCIACTMFRTQNRSRSFLICIIREVTPGPVPTSTTILSRSMMTSMFSREKAMEERARLQAWLGLGLGLALGLGL